jgi:uncharacterized protein UPF0182
VTLGGRRRGRALVITAACVAVLLVAGRSVAVETVEHAWAATVRGGPVYLEIRTLQRLLHWLVIFVSVLWGAGNLYIVYRAIGSVQMPRRIGNLEIVEAVPQRLLLTLAILIGVVFGLGLSWGTGDWWREAFLANAPTAVLFGQVDPILHLDAGFYAQQLPWAIEREQFLLISTLTAAVLCGFLYLGIGSLRWQRGRLVASPHARAHLGVLAAGVAAAILWGALLDPAEVVAGLHGALTTSLLSLRVPGSRFIVAAAGLAGALSIAWIWWDRPRWPVTGWVVVGLALLLVYGILPSVSRRNPEELYPQIPQDRRAFEEMAFGANQHLRSDSPEFPTMAAFVAAEPLWSAKWVAAVARGRLGSGETVAGVQLSRAAQGTPLWVVARAPNDTALSSQQPPPTWDQVHRGARTAAGAPLGLAETDSGALVPAPLDLRDSLVWFGEGFGQYAVTGGAALPASGIPLTGTWRRIALAWVLQSPEIARQTTDAEQLQWRRTPDERFALLAPFARFADAEPVLVDGSLWWRAVGYVSAETFPLVASVDTPDGPVRLLRAGLVGAMRATTGETRFWLLPGADSVTTAWARIFKPLIEPADSAPLALVTSLQFPLASFTLAAKRILAAAPDSENWQVAPHDPTDLLLPGDATPWLVQGFTNSSGGTTRLQLLMLGRFGDRGPELWSMIAPRNDPPPQLLVGSTDTQPGPLRIWIAGGHLASSQARFIAVRNEPPRIEHVFLTWGNRNGEGTSTSAALRELTLAGPPGGVDTTMTSRWTLAQHLFSQLDSALVSRDFERFGQVYRQLGDLLGARRRALAPTPPVH